MQYYQQINQYNPQQSVNNYKIQQSQSQLAQNQYYKPQVRQNVPYVQNNCQHFIKQQPQSRIIYNQQNYPMQQEPKTQLNQPVQPVNQSVNQYLFKKQTKPQNEFISYSPNQTQIKKLPFNFTPLNKDVQSKGITYENQETRTNTPPVQKIKQLKNDGPIREVWAQNFDEELREMMKALRKAKYVAMDTEFPGTVYKPKGGNVNNFEQYSMVRENCNKLKLIQIGFTLADENFKLLSGNSIWQFNLHFDLSKDKFNQDSINLLKNSGINFDKFKTDGIKQEEFAEKFVASGFVFNPNFTWVVFHGSYDFGYLVNLMSGEDLPQTVSQFFMKLKIYFPKITDIKHITIDIEYFSCGLNSMASKLDVKRIGAKHQAGSDSLVTLNVLHALQSDSFKSQLNQLDECMIYGARGQEIDTNSDNSSAENYQIREKLDCKVNQSENQSILKALQDFKSFLPQYNTIEQNNLINLQSQSQRHIRQQNQEFYQYDQSFVQTQDNLSNQFSTFY